jgi:superfamily II DNA or RNA helicase
MSEIQVKKLNNVYLKITSSDKAVIEELWEYFGIKVNNYQFNPKFKTGKWDGIIRLFRKREGKLYYGLLDQLKEFVRTSNGFHSLIGVDKLDKNLENPIIKTNYSIFEKFPLREYQKSAIEIGMKEKRCILQCPTGSGKSYIIHHLIQQFIYTSSPINNIDEQILIIVPSTNLVEQLYSDFQNYVISDKNSNNFNDISTYVTKIYAGFTKSVENFKVIISTYQSIYSLPSIWFSKIKFLLIDECHLASAKSLINISEQCINADIRIGTTGTLDPNSKAPALILQGLFGNVFTIKTTQKLIDENILASLEINIIILKYTPDSTKDISHKTYQSELKSIITNQKRNEFVANLATSNTLLANGNTLVLFGYIDLQGNELFRLISEKENNEKEKKLFSTHYITMHTKTLERKSIFESVSASSNVIIIGSYGLMSTGINIVHLNNIIFASPTKSHYRVLQSIGRGLRFCDKKTVIYDLVDFVPIRNAFTNTITMNRIFNHGIQRKKIYDAETFKNVFSFTIDF